MTLEPFWCETAPESVPGGSPEFAVVLFISFVEILLGPSDARWLGGPRAAARIKDIRGKKKARIVKETLTRRGPLAQLIFI